MATGQYLTQIMDISRFSGPYRVVNGFGISSQTFTLIVYHSIDKRKRKVVPVFN
jgi:hypothetical protein